MAIGHKLEKMISGKKEMDGALELVEQLGELTVTLDILTKTRIGLTINSLRKKSEDELLTKKAKSLLKNWKTLANMKSSDIVRSRSSKSSDSRNEDEEASPSDISLGGNNHKSSLAEKSNGVVKSGEMSELRTKSIEMLTNAFRMADLPDGTALPPEDLAARIEKKLFQTHGGTGDKYKAALRSRVFNLRDKKNPALRENVLTGIVQPEKFAVMTADEMASAEMKEKRESFTKEAILEHQLSADAGQPTDMFQCGKCKSKNCTYTQLQTRSADEPLTTFVYCRQCGNRWKFS